MSSANSDTTSQSPTDRQYVEAYSQQLLMDPDCEWGDLLSAAPCTLACLGQAFVAATSNAVNASVQIEKFGPLQYVEAKFNQIVSQLTSESEPRHNSLRVNLQHCADLGLEAFLVAEGRMKKLQLVADIVNSPGGSVSIVSSKRLPLSTPGLGDDCSD